ncbi:MAG: gamma-glutamyltransferase, partial [Gammaproteobacteria bacterium]
GLDAQTIVSNPRFHHQYLPDQIQVESIGFTSHDLESLEQHGHSIQKLSRQYGNMQVIIQNKITKQLTAASDPRGEGSSLVK